jgi:hypothetical protein
LWPLPGFDSERRDKLLKQLPEFDGYIQNNREFIPNYGERYRNGERISTRICGIDSEPSGEQADGQAATNATCHRSSENVVF